MAGTVVAVGSFAAYWLVDMSPQRDPSIVGAALEQQPPAAAEPAGARATAEPAVAAAPAPTAPPTDTEATPWPEREALAPTGQRPAGRLNTTLPSSPGLRHELGRIRQAGSGASLRSPATRRAAMGALAEADPAHKVAAAAPQPPRGAGPPATEAILGRGQAAFDRGDYPEALRRGREAIAAGGALGGHLLAGDAYYRLERLPDALREYQAALALDPGNTSIKRRRDLVEQAAAR